MGCFKDYVLLKFQFVDNPFGNTYFGAMIKLTVCSFGMIFALVSATTIFANIKAKYVYNCVVAFPKQEKLQELDIPFDSTSQTGQLEFDGPGAQKARTSIYGDAVSMELLAKINEGKASNWKTIGRTVASGNVRSAMLVGPAGLYVTCTQKK
jgi:hypothetical protein